MLTIIFAEPASVNVQTLRVNEIPATGLGIERADDHSNDSSRDISLVCHVDMGHLFPSVVGDVQTR
ncbi:hypothetical protein D3C86_866010 [compost metagenome]